MKNIAIFSAVVLFLSAAVFLVLLESDLLAQEGPWGGGGGGGGRGGRMRPPMGMTGGSAMVVHANHIFVLQGSVLHKIDPGEMKVVKTLEIKPPGEGEGGDRRGEGRKGW